MGGYIWWTRKEGEGDGVAGSTLGRDRGDRSLRITRGQLAVILSLGQVTRTQTNLSYRYKSTRRLPCHCIHDDALEICKVRIYPTRVGFDLGGGSGVATRRRPES